MKAFTPLLFSIVVLMFLPVAVGNGNKKVVARVLQTQRQTDRKSNNNSNKKVIARVLQTQHQTDRNGPFVPSILAASKRTGKHEIVSRRAKILSLLLPWLYFMAISLNIPNMPKYVNYQLSTTGSTDVTSRSASVYGSISGVDAFFTFLSVNLIGVLSDIYGRRPFMMMSALGLGLAYTITMHATYPTFFYAAAAIDGLTSCMFSQGTFPTFVSPISSYHPSLIKLHLPRFSYLFHLITLVLPRYISRPSLTYFISSLHNQTNLNPSQKHIQQTYEAQSYVADLNTQGGGEENISVVLGRFQGLAVGMAFLFGIPLGAILGIKGSLMTPLRVSIGICMLNALLIWFCLPETSTIQQPQQQQQPQQKPPPQKKIIWSNANPFGALKMLRRDQHLLTGAAAYLFVNIAQAGVQINWMNYLQYRFGWSAAKRYATVLVVHCYTFSDPTFAVSSCVSFTVFSLSVSSSSLSMFSVVVPC